MARIWCLQFFRSPWYHISWNLRMHKAPFSKINKNEGTMLHSLFTWKHISKLLTRHMNPAISLLNYTLKHIDTISLNFTSLEIIHSPPFLIVSSLAHLKLSNEYLFSFANFHIFVSINSLSVFKIKISSHICCSLAGLYVDLLKSK